MIVCPFHLEDALQVDGERLPGLVLAQLEAGLDHLDDLLLQHRRPLLLLRPPLRHLLGVLLQTECVFLGYSAEINSLTIFSDLFPPFLQRRPVTFLKRLLVLCNPQLSCTHDNDDESDDNCYDDDDIEEYDNNYIDNDVVGFFFPSARLRFRIN